MFSLRTKLIFFICLLIIIIDAFICLFFYIHSTREQENGLKKLGMSLVTLLAQDDEMISGIRYNQPAFAESSLNMVKAFDREVEIEYWRVTGNNEIIYEGKAPWSRVLLNEIPIIHNYQYYEGQLSRRMKITSGEVFYEFSTWVYEKQMLSEEAFATQMLSEDKSQSEPKPRLIGAVCLGFSTRKINERMHEILIFGVIPIGLGIIIGGTGITIYLTRYIVLPLQRLADVTLDIAQGNLNRTVTVATNDEIGQLSRNFNLMTEALSKSYADLRKEITEHERTEKLLKYQLGAEEIVSIASTSFINFTPDKLDSVINNSLRLLGEFAGVDRSYVFQFTDTNGSKISNTHEWCREGISSQINNLQGLPVESFPWWMEKLERLETIHIPRVSDLPGEAKAEKEIFQAQSILSLVAVPIVYSGNLIGFLGFDSVLEEKEWTLHDFVLLKVVGEVFANAFEHKRKEEQLRRANIELETRVQKRTEELSMANERLHCEVVEHKEARDVLKKYEMLFSQINDLPFICDTKGNILFVNRTLEKLTGHKTEEYIGKPFESLFDEENLKRANDVYRRTLLGEEPQFELCFKDTGILCEYKSLPLRDEKGDIIGVIGTARDISERKKMVDALVHAKEYAENLIETANVMVMGLDMDGNIQVFNHAAEEITGYKRNEVIGKSCFDRIIPKETYSFVWEMFNRWQAGGTLLKTFESLVITKSGKKRFISWQNSEIREHDKRMGTISFGIDITERKQMNILVERMRLTTFIKDVSVAFSKGSTLQEMLSRCTDVIVSDLEAMSAHIWLLNEKGSMLELQAGSGTNISLRGTKKCIPIETSGLAFITRDDYSCLTKLVLGDITIDDTEPVECERTISRIVYPLFAGDRFVGVVAMFGRKLFTEFTIKALAAVVDMIALGIDRKHSEDALRESKMRLQSILDNTTSVVYVKDIKGKYILINRVWERIFHLSNEQTIGRDDYEIFSQNIADVFRANDLMVIENRKPVEFEEVAPHDDGPHTYISVKFPLYDAAGEVYAICGISTDITARKHAEETLRESESKYRMLLESLPQRIFYKDANSRYVSCNKQYSCDLGINSDEIMGKTDYDFFPKEMADKYIADDRRIMQSGKTEDIEEKYVKDGREYFVQTVKTPVTDEGGKVMGILGIFWDITEKVNLQKESVSTRHLVSLGELAAGVAHEINNPINGIINCAQILIDKGCGDSNAEDITRRIIKEGGRIANIVSSLLSFARHGDRRDVKSPASVYGILSETLLLIGAQLRKDNISVKINMPEHFPEVLVNFQQIQQCFLNILSNARYALNQKYPETSDNKSIQIAGEETIIDNCPHVKIVFLDHGTGIPAKILDKVMNPFFTTKPRGKGTGLGLSISHGIITEHGGKLVIDSVEGEYTRVVITLPTMQKLAKRPA